MRLAIMAIILLSFPFAFALDCNHFSGQENVLCNEISQSDASSNEKRDLMAALAYKEINIANHSQVFDWNTNIKFSSTPDGVETKSSGSIKDAWMKVVAVMPSVISNGKLLSPGIGQVLTAYNYRIELPSGNDGGDCYTEYNIRDNNAQLLVYLNENQIGTSTLTDFQGSNELNFKADLRIQSSIEVKHSKNFKECCVSASYGCLYYCNVCKYDSTVVRTDEINLEDSKQALHYWPVIMPQIKIVDKYFNTTVGLLNISKFEAFELIFDNSSFAQYNYFYDINVSLPPFDVYTLRANNFTRKDSRNMLVEKFSDNYKFYVSNPDNCKLNFYDHFHSWGQKCNLDYNATAIKILTDQLQYNVDEIINVTLVPKDTLMEVKYGDEEISASNSVKFKAKQNVNKILAYRGEKQFQRVIHVKNKGTWDFALNLGVFSGILYSVYLFVKKYWGALLWKK
ncbi:MAG TPA: hypothetical protein VJJ52_05545 [Candidatus Nanoarchaeia archaeon]|nr:hypothetical protein [Candidatus Nanoarchaeia archaeon]